MRIRSPRQFGRAHVLAIGFKCAAWLDISMRLIVAKHYVGILKSLAIGCSAAQ